MRMPLAGELAQGKALQVTKRAPGNRRDRWQARRLQDFKHLARDMLDIRPIRSVSTCELWMRASVLPEHQLDEPA